MTYVVWKGTVFLAKPLTHNSVSTTVKRELFCLLLEQETSSYDMWLATSLHRKHSSWQTCSAMLWCLCCVLTQLCVAHLWISTSVILSVFDQYQVLLSSLLHNVSTKSFTPSWIPICVDESYRIYGWKTEANFNVTFSLCSVFLNSCFILYFLAANNLNV